jgi:hypothetical protein
VIKIDSEKRSGLDFFSDYKLMIMGTGKNFLLVSPKFPYAFETDLPPGEYVLRRIIPSISRKQHRAGGVTNHEIPFVLEAGQVMIFPFALHVQITESRDPHDAGAAVQRYDLRRITTTRRKEILEEMKEFKNFEKWESLNVPQ